MCPLQRLVSISAPPIQEVHTQAIQKFSWALGTTLAGALLRALEIGGSLLVRSDVLPAGAAGL